MNQYKMPEFYVLRTLLGGDPDINQRTIYDKDHRAICHFNREMAPWTKQHQKELDVCLRALFKDSEKE